MRASLIRAEALLYRQRRQLTAGAGVAMGAALVIAGLGQGFDDALRAWRDAVRSQDASGEIVVVEIDAKSMAAIDRWPWPRRHHAALVDALRDGGAETIAFDVDFSNPSDPVDDAALAASLARDGGVILPTFRQVSGIGQQATLDTLPVPALRAHATLAAVTVEPDRDGMIRRIPLGATTGGLARPSLAAMLADVSSTANQSFPIDYSIDPGTIPSYSFVDVVRRSLPRDTFAGKRVVIGATAIELGDRYAIPRHGVVPGVVVQALAAETLLAGRIPIGFGPVPALLAALLAIGALAWRTSRAKRSAIFAAAMALLIAGPLATEAWFGVSVALAPALAAMAAAALAAAALTVAHSFTERMLRNAGTALPNLAALELDWNAAPRGAIAVARIAEYAKLTSGLGADGMSELVRKLAERLALVSEGDTLYRTEESTLAWRLDTDDGAALDTRFAAAAALMRMPLQSGGKNVDVTLHFGVADLVAGATPAQLVADAALAAAEAAAKGARWERFVQGGQEETRWQLSLLGALDRAIEADDLWVAYQAKLDIATGQTAGAEALVRWRHPERGNIAPDDFIPVAEANGRVGALTEFVLRRALGDFAKLDDALSISVNVAANLLADRAVVAMVEDALLATGVRPGRLVLEITESAAMAQPEEALATLVALNNMGVKLSIDDYGTGQSTLSYLKRLPAAELKIDKSFIQQLSENRSDEILVGSTIKMAHDLGLRVVAEGVEDLACLERLRKLGCDLAQGWLTGKPVPIDDFVAALAEAPRKAA